MKNPKIDTSENSTWSRLWKLISNNFWLKVLSLFFSLVLFAVVRTEQSREYIGTARVRIKTNESMMVIGPSERVVSVTLKYPQALFFRQPEERELTGEVNAKNEHSGKVRVRLSRENFPLLDKTFTLIVHDPIIDFELDDVVHRVVDVRAHTVGRPAQGYSLEKIIVEPEQVEVSGARRELINIRELVTSPLSIEGLDRTLSARAKVAIDENSSLRLKDDWVNVQLMVVADMIARTFTNITIEVNGGAIAEINPKKVSIELEGPRVILDALHPSDVRVFLDAWNLQPGWQEQSLRLQIPPDTSLIKLTPTMVSVKVGR